MFGRALGGWSIGRAFVTTVLAVVVVLLVIAIDRSTALAGVGDVVVLAQEESPYQVDVTTVETPFWLEPWGPLTGLPVWAAAAVLAGVATASILVVLGIGRWIWSTFFDRKPWA